MFLHVQSPLRERRSIRSGASGLPYYCAPLVCVSDVMEVLAVWRHNKPKTKKKASQLHFLPPLASPPPSAAAGEPIWDPRVFTIMIIFFPYWWLSDYKLFSLSVYNTLEKVWKRMQRRRECTLWCRCMRWSMQPTACVVGVPCACARFVGMFCACVQILSGLLTGWSSRKHFLCACLALAFCVHCSIFVAGVTCQSGEASAIPSLRSHVVGFCMHARAHTGIWAHFELPEKSKLVTIPVK